MIDPIVGPHRGDHDDPIVGLAHPPQIPPAHMGCLVAVLTTPGVIDDQRTPPMRPSTPISQQQLQPPRVDHLIIPTRLGHEVPQPLHHSMLRPSHQPRPSHTSQPDASVSCCDPAAPTDRPDTPETRAAVPTHETTHQSGHNELVPTWSLRVGGA